MVSKAERRARGAPGRRRSLRVSAAVACLLAGTAPADALEADRLPSQYAHQRWTRADGLPSDLLWSLIQTADGFLWIASQSGLVRFDGHAFDVFSSDNVEALLVDDVRALAEDPDDGSLWVATYGGGIVRRDADGRFSRHDRTSGLVSDVVYDVILARDGSLWAGTAAGACRLQGERFRCWTGDDGLLNERVSSIAEDEAGTIWVATLAGGVARFEGEDRGFRAYAGEAGLDNPQVLLLTADPQHGILFGTYSGRWYRAGADGPVPIDAAIGIPAGRAPLSAVRDSAGNLWIGINGGGVWRAGDTPVHLQAPWFGAEHVFGLAEDRDGALWVASRRGLHRFSAAPFVPFGSEEGVSERTFVVAVDPVDGAVWAGAEGDGLYRVGPDGGVSRLTVSDGLPAASVSALLAEADGTVWAGTFGGGVARIRERRVAGTLSRADGLPSDQIASLHRDALGALWIGTGGGLSRVVDGRVTHTFTRADGLATSLVRHIAQDAAGRLLLASDAGLSRLDASDLTVVDTLTRERGLASDVVAVTYVAGDGVVWIGSRSGGLARLDGDDLFQFGRRHGLTIRSIMGIVEDRDGYLWLAGRDGVSRVSRHRLEQVARAGEGDVGEVTFAERDGLRSIETPGGFQSAVAEGHDGRIWLATSRGLAAAAPGQVLPPPPLTSPVILGVRVDGAAVWRARDSDPVIVPAGARLVEIDYTVPSLGRASDLAFHYRLGTGRGDWQHVEQRRTAFFTSLRPGKQRFEVAATWAGAGVEALRAASPAALTLAVGARWFQTVWAAAGAVLAAMGLAYGVFRIALAGMNRRQRELEHLVAERTAALRAALGEVEQLSLTDSLTQVANRRHFERHLAMAWERAHALALPLSVVMIDIDYFKQYNDDLGHPAGDRCLKAVAGAVAEHVRTQDVVARYGGEEFVILLPGTDLARTLAVAERVQGAVATLAIPHPARPDGEDVATVSIGIATAWPGVLADAAPELIQRADRALYDAKRQGRNRIVVDRESTEAAAGRSR